MKTITVRVDDNVYNVLKKAADGERRTISNFIENASLSYFIFGHLAVHISFSVCISSNNDPLNEFARLGFFI